MLLQNLPPPPPSVGTERSSNRLLRSAAAITLAACLSAFAADPAWSYKAGQGANDIPGSIPVYANVAAFLADENNDTHPYVTINGNTLETARLRGFHSRVGLTDSNILAEYTTVADYLADSQRASRVYAKIGSSTYEVTLLESVISRDGTLTVATLPNAFGFSFGTTAVGEGAGAGHYFATAVGSSATVKGSGGVALGLNSTAEAGSIAVGQDARTYSPGTTAVGFFAYTHEHSTTAIGHSSSAIGSRSSAIGSGAYAIGDRNLAVGASAEALALSSGQSFFDTLEDGAYSQNLIECALEEETERSIEGFVVDCEVFLQQSERDSALLSADSQAGVDFRNGIRARLTERLEGFAASEATAVGHAAKAWGEDSTALGADAHARADDSTALGENSLAAAEDSTAVGASSQAIGEHSVALGENSTAFNEGSVSIGRNTKAQGDRATSVGRLATVSGAGSSAFGSGAVSFGESNTILGRAAYAVNLPFAASPWNEIGNVQTLTECAFLLEPRYTEFLQDSCGDFLSQSEMSDNRLAADSQAGRDFRAGIQQRLQDEIDTFTVESATAVGTFSGVYGDYGTAVGQWSRSGYGSTSVGSGSVASGDRSTAVGTWSYVTGDFGTSLGVYAQSHGTHGVALGRHGGAGSWTIWSHYDNAADFVANHGDEQTDAFVVIANRIYSVRDLKAVASLTDSNLPTPVSTSTANIIGPLSTYRSVDHYLEDTDRTNYRDVIIGGHAYAVSDLEAVAGLTAETLPEPLVGADGAISVGFAAQAPARDAIAIGREAVALGDEGIAIGHRVVAGENDVVVGTADHSYWLPGLSASQTTNTELVSVDSSGQLASDGGALHARVDTVETGLGAASDSASATGSAYARINSLRQLVDALGDDPSNADLAVIRQAVQDVEASLGAPSDSADAAGSAYARIADVQGGLQTVEDSLGSASDAADAAGSAFARVNKLQTDLGVSSDPASATGSAYARISNTQAGLKSVEDSLGGASDAASATGTAFARIAHVSSELGKSGDAASATGSAYARISQLQTGLGEQSDASSVTGSAYARIKHFQEALDDAESEQVAIASAVSKSETAIAQTNALVAETQSLVQSTIVDTDGLVEQIEEDIQMRLADIQTNARDQLLRIVTQGADGTKTVVALRGPTNEQIQTLVALLTSGAGAGEVIRDSQGNPVGTNGREFRALDDPNTSGDDPAEPDPIPVGSNNRLGYLFEALYGDPNDGVTYNPDTDSDTPHEESAFGRIGALEEGSLPSAYRSAPNIGSGANAPRTADQRRIVVQDQNADGSIQLSTIGFSDLTAVDRRVADLGTRLDQATAMTTALSGLPSMVPGTGELFLGVGLGNYGSESAVAVGGAAKLSSNLFVNIGASTSSAGGDKAFRAGAGIVW